VEFSVKSSFAAAADGSSAQYAKSRIDVEFINAFKNRSIRVSWGAGAGRT
jgi:hypothetical protein